MVATSNILPASLLTSSLLPEAGHQRKYFRQQLCKYFATSAAASRNMQSCRAPAMHDSSHLEFNLLIKAAKNSDDIIDIKAFVANELIQVLLSCCQEVRRDRKSTRLNSSHSQQSRMPSSA